MAKLTKESIKDRIEKIDIYDDEQAHCDEDDLFYDFVDAIISGDFETITDIKEAAIELSKVRELDFCRWHA